MSSCWESSEVIECLKKGTHRPFKVDGVDKCVIDRDSCKHYR